MRFIPYYIYWHYSQALVDLVGIVRNFVWFFYEFFSIPLLVRTLFMPFQRLGEQYNRTFSPILWMQSFIINSMM